MKRHAALSKALPPADAERELKKWRAVGKAVEESAEVGRRHRDAQKDI
jgi:hypothetical protein